MTTTSKQVTKHTLTEEQAEDMYNEALDERGAVRIGSGVYYPSEILKKLDPIAYQVGFNDYIDSLMKDGHTIEGWS